MKARVEQILNNNTELDTLRYFLYSAHDVQVANVLHWLEPVEYENVDVPYVSNFHFELHYNEETCLSNSQVLNKQEECFTVKTLYNGQPLKFSTCLEANQLAGRHSDRCTFKDFVEHINSLSFKGDLARACSLPWNQKPSTTASSLIKDMLSQPLAGSSSL